MIVKGLRMNVLNLPEELVREMISWNDRCMKGVLYMTSKRLNREQDYIARYRHIFDRYHIVDLAIKRGYVEIVEWCKENYKGLKFPRPSELECVVATGDIKGAEGMINKILEGGEGYREVDELKTSLPIIAILNGRLEMLKWLDRVLVCSDGLDLKECETCAAKLLGTAIWAEEKEIEEWMIEEGYEKDQDVFTEVMGNIRGLERIEIVERMIENGYELNETICHVVAQGGNLQLLKWLMERGHRMTQQSYLSAVLGGNIEILNWLQEIGYKWEKGCVMIDMSFMAAMRGQLDILKWLKKNGKEWIGCECERAAEKGHIEALSWLMRNGCSWDRTKMIENMSKGTIEEAEKALQEYEELRLQK